jgi:hypothetical protein
MRFIKIELAAKNKTGSSSGYILSQSYRSSYELQGRICTYREPFIPSMDTNKKASRRGGCTNQIPLTIKPYPMPPSYGIIEYTSIFCLIKLKTKSISIFW